MSDRGLPIVDGAPACPFVAFADDRDERATSPDHRHRCYAEMRPAPRALAHQEAYCLASAFPVCPTFQDWARREAARARSGPSGSTGSGAAAGSPAVERPPEPGVGWVPTGVPAPVAAGAAGAAAGAAAGTAEARPSPDAPDVSAPGFLASRDRAGGGLAGSAADRLASERAAAGGGEHAGDDSPPASGQPAGAVTAPGGPPPFLGRSSASESPSGRRDAGEWLDDEVERQDASWPEPRPQPAGSRPRREPNVHQDWERPRRDAHPTRRTRTRIPRLTGIWLAVAGLAIAALVLFLAPGFLRGLGSGGPGSSPAASPSAAAAASPSASPSPSPTPEPSLYVVEPGDTLSEIAERFGVTLQALIEANAQRLPDPNNLQIGDELIIPPSGARPGASGPASGSPLP